VLGPFRAVVFDMDGLMLDTEAIAQAASIDTARELGFEFSRELYLSLVGNDWATCVQILKRALGENFDVEAFGKRCGELERERMREHGIPLKPGLVALLDWLDSIHVPYGIATSTSPSGTEFRLRRVGIYDRFASITTRSEVPNGKPAPDIYLLAAKKLAAEPAELLVFEDSHVGVRAGHAAGAKVIMIPDMLPPTPEMEALAFKIFPSLTQAHEFLSKGP
jgi:HAD superfamily hydrolase (TIGR01509 family)